jgi:hypothetical protein
MPRKKKEPAQGFNIFQCQLCADHPQFSAGPESLFTAHMTEAHQMDMKQKFQKSMVCHLDARDWYQWDYEWKRDGVTFALQSVRNPRRASYADDWSAE